MKDDKLRLIRKTNPNLKIQKIDFIESGFHSLAVIVNNEYVFRFPLKKEFFEEYANENKLLNIINKSISTRIPFLEVYNIDDEIFTKHKIIHGEQYANISGILTNNEKNDLAKELAKFIAELHAIKSDEIQTSQFSISDYINSENINILYDYLKERKKEFDKVLESFDIESKSLKNENIVICHNDLNENNILVDTKTKRLAGIIDFGNSVKRDFSSEFASLLKYDFDFMLKIIEEYEKITGREVNLNYAILLQRIRCYGVMADGLIGNKSYRVEMGEKWLAVLKNSIFAK